jgi:hypothetical protein
MGCVYKSSALHQMSPTVYLHDNASNSMSQRRQTKVITPLSSQATSVQSSLFTDTRSTSHFCPTSTNHGWTAFNARRAQVLQLKARTSQHPPLLQREDNLFFSLTLAVPLPLFGDSDRSHLLPSTPSPRKGNQKTRRVTCIRVHGPLLRPPSANRRWCHCV